MANWMIYAASAFGKPVWEQMKAELLESSVIHADETVVQVLNEPGKKAKRDSRMWVYCNGKLGEHSNILFEYQPPGMGTMPSGSWGITGDTWCAMDTTGTTS